MGGQNRGIQQALGIKAIAQLGEHTLILNGFHIIQDPLTFGVGVLHGGHQGAHLKGGAGGVVRAEGPVEEGLQLVVHDIVPVLVHGLQVEGGIAGAGQNFAGLDLHDHHGRALSIQAGALAGRGVDLRID